MAIDDWPLECRTGQTCPRCKRAEIVYNGNYFCSDYVTDSMPPDWACNWAMEETDHGPLFRRCYAGLMANRERAKEIRASH